MREEFLHYAWQHQLFNKDNLITTQGQKVSIYSPGFHNHHSGPDYSMSKIKIDQLEWHGNVEIHYRSSDWKNHQHHTDAAYDNVILHIVWKDDAPIKNLQQGYVPTIVLNNRIDPLLIAKFDELIKNKNKIPCENTFPEVDALVKLAMLDRVMAERLELKSDEVLQLLVKNNHDWEETTYQLLAKNFGFKVNSQAMLTLSEKLSLKILAKQTGKVFELESLLMGHAGLLDDYFKEEYPLALKKEYQYLAKKHDLLPSKMTGKEWKFSKMRPPNFPTIRLAELASLLANRQHLFSKILEADSFTMLSEIFKVSLSGYWDNHYVFDKPSASKPKSIGKSSIENLILNTVVPLLVCYSKEKSQQEHMDRAIQFLETIVAEQNNITTYWQSLGQPVKTAFDSQALIGLHNNYCKRKACLQCTIGNSILSKP